MNLKKIGNLAGIAVGIIILILGIVISSGALFDTAGISSPASYYDYGYAQFGGDYNSYSNNNMAYASKAAAATNANIVNLMELISAVGGMMMIALGLLSCCYFVTKLDIELPCKKAVAPATPIATTPVELPVEEAAQEPAAETAEETVVEEA